MGRRRRRGLTAFRDEVCILESAREEPGEGAEGRLERRDRRHVVRDERLVRHRRRDALSQCHHHGPRPARAVRSPHRKGMALHTHHRRPKGQSLHPHSTSSSPTPSRSSSPPAPPPCTSSSSSLKPSSWPKSLPLRRNASSKSVISRTGWFASASSSPSSPLLLVLRLPTQSSLPPDFRLKEMEKWFKEQQKRTNALLHPQPIDCPQCIASRRPNRNLPPKPSDVTPPSAKPKISPKVAMPPPSRRSVSSPPPLPHLLRISNLATGFDLSIDPQRIPSLPQTPPPQTPPRPQQQLTRRRSCIKRTSTGDFTKTVSWADDHGLTEHLSKYASLARQAQLSGQLNRSLVPSLSPLSFLGRKWEDIRDIYLDQMNGLEALHQQVEQCMEHLRLESDNLKRADETIRGQREILRTTFEDFEKKQIHFQTQGTRSPPRGNSLLAHLN